MAAPLPSPAPANYALAPGASLGQLPHPKRVLAGLPGRQELLANFQEYLGAAGMNVLLLVATVALFTHLAMVIYGQDTFEHGTLVDLLAGPMLVIVLAGLLGVAFILANLGHPQQVYDVLYIPFGIITIGVGLWAVLGEPHDVDGFRMPVLDRLQDGSPRAWAVLALALCVLTAFLGTWASGRMRLDALSVLGANTGVLVAFTSLFTLGLSKMFELVLRTLDRQQALGSKESIPYAVAYLGSVFGAFVLVAAAVQFLDLALIAMGGTSDGFYAPGNGQEGVGGSHATYETHRTFRLALVVVVVTSAALMWRRRYAVRLGDSSDTETPIRNSGGGNASNVHGDGVATDWAQLLAILAVLPTAALITEVLKDVYFREHAVAFDVARGLALAVAVLMVGTGFFPWNVATLLGTFAVAAFAALRSFDFKGQWEKPVIAFCLCALFALGNLAVRAVVSERQRDAGGKTNVSQFGAWLYYVLLPAALVGLVGIKGFATGGKRYRRLLMRFYFFFVLALVFTMDFSSRAQGDPQAHPMAPMYEIVPGNEAASVAIDGVLVFCALVASTSLNLAFVDAVPLLGRYETYRAQEAVPSTLYYATIGLIAATTYVSLRGDPVLADFARTGQKASEDWYLRLVQDGQASIRRHDSDGGE